MATTNLAENEQQKTVKELFCSAELPHVVHGKLTNIRIVKNLRQNSFLRVENIKSHRANYIAPLFSGASAPSVHGRIEFHTLGNLVTHRSEKCNCHVIVRACVRPSVRTPIP